MNTKLAACVADVQRRMDNDMNTVEVNWTRKDLARERELAQQRVAIMTALLGPNLMDCNAVSAKRFITRARELADQILEAAR